MAGEMKPSKAWLPNPLRCGGMDIPMPLPLVAKLIVVCLLARLTWLTLPVPFLPFLAVLDYFHNAHLFAWGLRGTALIGAVSVLFNYRLRAAYLAIGVSFLLGILASRVYFENNLMFLGCVFVLLGLSDLRTGAWLIRAQVILLFFAAASNKILDASWRSGRFFDFWGKMAINKNLYFQLASWLPAMFLPRVMSWMTIAMEFTICFGLLFRRTRIWAIWIGLLLSLGMNVLTERTFGVFFYLMPICYLAFADWPRSAATVLYDGDCGLCARTRKVMERLDIEGMFDWKPFQQASDLHGIPQEALRQRLYVVTEKKKYSGFAAFRIMALYNPLTYFAILVTLLGPQALYFHHRSLVAAFFVFLFSPFFVPIGQAAYDVVARNRHAIFPGGSCSVDTFRTSRSSAPWWRGIAARARTRTNT
jgi:predicted DCC family thiol-disulfide oxidoreductase YuxK